MDKPHSKTLLVAACLAAIGLSGCITQPAKTAPPADADTMALLTTYADRASISMQRLASIRGAHAGVQIEEFKVPVGMEVPVSINWSGPIEELAKKVAGLTGYAYDGIQGVPKTPVLVTINVVNTPAFNVLADAGAQAGSAADLVIHPDSKTLLVKFPTVARTGGYPAR